MSNWPLRPPSQVMHATRGRPPPTHTEPDNLSAS